MFTLGSWISKSNHRWHTNINFNLNNALMLWTLMLGNTETATVLWFQ